MTPDDTLARPLLDLLAETPPFTELDADVRASLLQDITISYVQEGDVLLRQGSTVHDYLYIVSSGLIRLIDQETGWLLDKCGRGQTFGSFGMIKGGARLYEAQAMEQTTVALLDAKRFVQLYDAYPAFSAYFDQDLHQFIRHRDLPRDIAGRFRLTHLPLDTLRLPPPVFCAADQNVAEVSAAMTATASGTALITEGDQVTGIITDRVLRDAYITAQRPPSTQAREIQAPLPPMIAPDASLLDALTVFLNEESPVLLVATGTTPDAVAGVVAEYTLAHFRGIDPLATLHLLDRYDQLETLPNIQAVVHEQNVRLYRQGIVPERLTALLTSMYDALLRRIMALALTEVSIPDDAFALIALGDMGRREMTLTSSINLALIHSDAVSADTAKALAERIQFGLAQCGFSTSVLETSTWTQSATAWQAQFSAWVQSGGAAEPAFLGWLDARFALGHEALALTVLSSLQADASAVDLRPAMRATLEHDAPSPSLFQRFTPNAPSSLNLRTQGTAPATALIRALAWHYLENPPANTYDRLRALMELPDLTRPLADLLSAYRLLSDFRAERQVRQVELSEAPANVMPLQALSRMQRTLLNHALGIVRDRRRLLNTA
ncbi:MAG: putative nucleotidyltransferase substrate binding domain-containing protein [Rhodothermales bacterium]